MKIDRLFVYVHLCALTLACAPQRESAITDTSPTPDATPATGWAFTSHRADGNRRVDGSGIFPSVRSLDIPLKEPPAWIVAAPHADGAIVCVLGDGGAVEAFLVTADEATSVPVAAPTIPPPTPLLVHIDGDMIVPWRPASGDLSAQTVAAVLADGELVTTIHGAVRWSSTGAEAELDALPDGRFAVADNGDVAVLGRASQRYPHDVLGDALEAGSLSVLRDGLVVAELVLPEPEVFEGIMPMWADLDQDGALEIVVARSDPEEGTRLAVYDAAGEPIAAGPPVGTGYRWIHPLAVAAFGPDGGVELTGVRLPHVTGNLEFYRLHEGEFEVVAEYAGFTSHFRGENNLDKAIAGDFDGDGIVEQVLVSQAADRLAAIERTPDGAAIAWELELGGVLTTNLAATSGGAGMILAAGRADRILRVFRP